METKMTTKQKIVHESLKLFSIDGYDGVSMREIASAVGIKCASLYSHFKGKEDIFNAIFIEMKNLYDGATTMMNIPSQHSEETLNTYHMADEAQLLNMAESLFSFFTHNEFAAMFRKLLISQQYKSLIAAKCLKEYYIEAPIIFQSQIFKGLQQMGDFQSYDAEIMALHFYSPIYFILNKLDLGYSYDECLDMVKKHVHSFCRIYIK